MNGFSLRKLIKVTRVGIDGDFSGFLSVVGYMKFLSKNSVALSLRPLYLKDQMTLKSRGPIQIIL